MYALQNVVSSAWAGIAASATRPSASDAHVKALFIFTSRFLRWSPFDVPARTTSTPAGVDVGFPHRSWCGPVGRRGARPTTTGTSAAVACSAPLSDRGIETWESGESRPRDGDEVKEGVVLPRAVPA